MGDLDLTLVRAIDLDLDLDPERAKMVVPMSAKIGDKRCSLNPDLDLFLSCEVEREGAALRFDVPLVRVGDRDGERVRFGDIWRREEDSGGMT